MDMTENRSKTFYNYNQLIKIVIKDEEEEAELNPWAALIFSPKSPLWRLMRKEDINNRLLNKWQRFDPETKKIMNLRYIRLYFIGDFTYTSFYFDKETICDATKNLQKRMKDINLSVYETC